jgi:4-diphosphocytidyl-2-C-methyl-D-erythritol kinase
VFQLIDLCDWIELEARDGGRIERCSGLDGIPAEQDLCVRAARLLQAETGCRLGARIAIDKRIPMGGGLGGGSSDAATVLHGLNRIWNTGLDLDALAALGLRLGADVPVFIRGASAWAEGVGDRITPLALPEAAYLVLDSGVSVATAELFQAPELTRDAPPATIAGFVSGQVVGNAFEPVLLRRSPKVGEALRALREAAAGEASQVALSGTGGCCFARFENPGAAARAQARLGAEWRSWISAGLGWSPVHALLDARGEEPDERKD